MGLVFTAKGKDDFEVPRDHEWFAFPTWHDLLWVQTQPAGEDHLVLIVRWLPTGQWRAAFAYKPRRKRWWMVQREHFHSEDEAKRFLETRAALHPKGDS